MNLLEAIFKWKNAKKRNLTEGGAPENEIILLRTPDKSSVDFDSLAPSEIYQISSLLQFSGVVSLSWAERKLYLFLKAWFYIIS